MEAASLRERFHLGRKVASTGAADAEGAATAGETSFKSFMVALRSCGSSVAIIQQYFVNTISRLLLPVDGAHASSCEEMASAMSSAESSACKGLHQCIDIVIAEESFNCSLMEKIPSRWSSPLLHGPWKNYRVMQIAPGRGAREDGQQVNSRDCARKE